MLCMVVLGFSAQSDAKSSSTEAKQMVTKAVTYLKIQGKEKAFNEFCNTQGQFRKGELYVFVIDLKADIVAHGGKRKMIGKGSVDLTDPEGKYFLKEIVNDAKLKALTKKYKVQGYPHVVIEGADGQIMAYNGDRTAKALYNHV